MNEIITNRLKENEGKTILVFLHNNFRYTGKCLNSDENFVEILDFKTDKIMVINISEIKMVEVEGGEE